MNRFKKFWSWRNSLALRRSDDKLICGTCAGIALWLHINPWVIRAGSLLALLRFGLRAGIIAYLLLSLLLPPPKQE